MEDEPVRVASQFPVSVLDEVKPDATPIPPAIVVRICPDCGTASDGDFCSNCGEHVRPTVPTLKDYLKELFNEILSFDSKLIRTIPALLVKPGFLTNEYIAGRRKRYLLPWRVYILVAFVAFFLLNSYIHLELGTWIASGSKRLFLKGLRELSTQAQTTYLETVARLWSNILPYFLLLECSPLFALSMKLIHRKSKKLFAEHLIFTFHLFAFSLILILPAWASQNKVAQHTGELLMVVYLTIATYKVYGSTRWNLAWQSLLSGIAFFILIMQAVIFSLLLSIVLGEMFHMLPALAPEH